MPKFDLVAIDEALLKTATGKKAQILREYMGYIEQVPEGKAGVLRASEGERTGSVRRRLGAAARVAGKQLTIKRVGLEVYFWAKAQSGPALRRGGRRSRRSAPSA